MNNKSEQIWKNFSAGLKGFIIKRINNSSNADDILQEVFLKIHSKVDSLRDETKVKSWVYQIAQNTITDYYRKPKYKFVDIESLMFEPAEEFSTEKPEFEGLISLPEHYDDGNLSMEIAAGLREMVESLPEIYAQALCMVEFEGISQTEMAKKLGISISGAKSRVQRGRQMLKDILMRGCHFEFDAYGSIIDCSPKTCCCCN